MESVVPINVSNNSFAHDIPLRVSNLGISTLIFGFIRLEFIFQFCAAKLQLFYDIRKYLRKKNKNGSKRSNKIALKYSTSTWSFSGFALEMLTFFPRIALDNMFVKCCKQGNYQKTKIDFTTSSQGSHTWNKITTRVIRLRSVTISRPSSDHPATIGNYVVPCNDLLSKNL